LVDFFVNVLDKLCSSQGKYIKVKAKLLQAWTDPEGSRSLMLPDFKAVYT
jgi:hypothetical protein